VDIGEIRDAKIELDAWLQLSWSETVRRHGERVLRGLEFCKGSIERGSNPVPSYARIAVWVDLIEMAKAAGRSDRLTSVLGTG